MRCCSNLLWAAAVLSCAACSNESGSDGEAGPFAGAAPPIAGAASPVGGAPTSGAGGTGGMAAPAPVTMPPATGAPTAGSMPEAGVMAGPDEGAMAGEMEPMEPEPVAMEPAGPRIPEPTEPCPDFSADTQTIKGLRTQIEAGTPGESRGAILFNFHGTGGRGRLTSVPASVRAEITAEGGIVLAPTGNMGGGGRTDLAPPTGAWFVEDMEFVDLVVACGVRDHNIDPNRIYATGCSAGGIMAGSLGLMRSEYMAAVAPNSGGINWEGSRRLSEPMHGPAAFTMHGGSGDNVIVNFQDTSLWFHAQNRMAANMPFQIDCDHGRGHCGAPTSLHEMAWEFMKAHPYDVTLSPWQSSPPPDLPSYCVDVTAAPAM